MLRLTMLGMIAFSSVMIDTVSQASIKPRIEKLSLNCTPVSYCRSYYTLLLLLVKETT